MSKEDEIFSQRQEMFRQYETGNYSVSELCRRFGLSRTWFYKLRTRREQQGEDGLRISGRGRPGSFNQFGGDVELLVLQYVREHPTHGPGKIAAGLSEGNVGSAHMGHTAVYGVLRKHDLNTRSKRLAWQRATKS